MTTTHSSRAIRNIYRQSEQGAALLAQCHGREGRSSRARVSHAGAAGLSIAPSAPGGPSTASTGCRRALVTLRDHFVGYVLPSKIHACVDSDKRILFIGSRSPMFICWPWRAGADRYHRVDVGDVEGVVSALHAIERAVASEREPVSCG